MICHCSEVEYGEQLGVFYEPGFRFTKCPVLMAYEMQNGEELRLYEHAFQKLRAMRGKHFRDSLAR
ncbi:MAG: hypothetical protein M3120_06355 [Pseudomonadota bacterium]|nr:hypothetical protein [Pseudomonadota bacterium]